jgi:hypothetical protein
MANRNFNDVQGLGRAFKVLAGSVTPSTGSAVLSVSGCLGFTVTRTATGSFQCAFTNPWPKLLGASVQYAPSASIDGTYIAGRSIVAVPNGTYDVASAKLYTFNLVQMSGSNSVKAGTPIDVDGTRYDRIHFIFVMQNTKDV